jgi:hypothetical protein
MTKASPLAAGRSEAEQQLMIDIGGRAPRWQRIRATRRSTEEAGRIPR